MATLTLAQMQAEINAGRGVIFAKRVRTTLADLPTQAEIDAYNPITPYPSSLLIVDAREFGFTGAGQSTAALDRTAITDAIAALPDAGGIVMLPPNAEWYCETTYDIERSNVYIVGDPNGRYVITGPVDNKQVAYWVRYIGNGVGNEIENVGLFNLHVDASAWWDGTTRKNTGTCQAGSTEAIIVLAADNPAVSGDYPSGTAMFILEDAGNALAVGEDLTISSYNATTKQATLSGTVRNFTLVPSAVSSTTFTLPTNLIGLDSAYVVGKPVKVTAGTGLNTTATIESYNSGTGVCTLTVAGWSSTQPNTSSTITVYIGIPTSQAKYGILLPGTGGASQDVRGVGRIGVYHAKNFVLDNFTCDGGHGKLDFRNAKGMKLTRLHCKNVMENVVNCLVGTLQTDQCEDLQCEMFHFENVGEGYDLAVDGFSIGMGHVEHMFTEDETFDCNWAKNGRLYAIHSQNANNFVNSHGAFQSYTDGADLTSNQDIEIVGCVAENFKGCGVSFKYGWSSGGDMTRQQANYATKGVNIIGCTFRSNVLYPDAPVTSIGVWVGSTISSSNPVPVDDVKIIGCTIDVMRRGVLATFCRNLKIADCTIISQGDDAVEIGYNITYLAEQVKLHHNTLKGYVQGVDIISGRDISLEKNDIWATTGYGVKGVKCCNVDINRNNFMFSGIRHIWIALTETAFTDTTWTGTTSRNLFDGENDLGLNIEKNNFYAWAASNELARLTFSLNAAGTYRGIRVIGNKGRLASVSSQSGIRFQMSGSTTALVADIGDNEIDSGVTNPINIDTSVVWGDGTRILHDKNRVNAIAMTSANKTMTFAEWDADVLILSGTLGASRDLITPAQLSVPGKILEIKNGASHDVVCKVVSQTGVTITAGTTKRVYNNGTDYVLIN